MYKQPLLSLLKSYSLLSFIDNTFSIPFQDGSSNLHFRDRTLTTSQKNLGEQAFHVPHVKRQKRFSPHTQQSANVCTLKTALKCVSVKTFPDASSFKSFHLLSNGPPILHLYTTTATVTATPTATTTAITSLLHCATVFLFPLPQFYSSSLL